VLLASTGLLAVVSPEPAPARVACDLAWRAFPSPSFAHASLNGLGAAGPHDLWAAGNGYSGGTPTRVIVEHWDGRRWRGSRLPERASIHAVSATSNDDVWVVGSTLTFQPLILHRGPQGWAETSTPLADRFDEIWDVAALRPDDAWAVGAAPGVDRETPLILHWDGTSWTRIAPPADLETPLSSIAAVSADDLWAVGPTEETLDGLVPVVIHWDGTAWHRLVAEKPRVDLLGATASSAHDLWFSGSTPGTARRGVVVHGNGSRLRLVHTAGGVSRTGGLYGADFLNAVAVAGHEVWAVGNLEIDRWDGKRWFQRLFRGVDFNAVVARSPQNAWAVGGAFSGRTVVYHYACR
jgi:hypothetical protein